jgi:hypothetical protein
MRDGERRQEQSSEALVARMLRGRFAAIVLLKDGENRIMRERAGVGARKRGVNREMGRQDESTVARGWSPECSAGGADAAIVLLNIREKKGGGKPRELHRRGRKSRHPDHDLIKLLVAPGETL